MQISESSMIAVTQGWLRGRALLQLLLLTFDPTRLPIMVRLITHNMLACHVREY